MSHNLSAILSSDVSNSGISFVFPAGASEHPSVTSTQAASAPVDNRHGQHIKKMLIMQLFARKSRLFFSPEKRRETHPEK